MASRSRAPTGCSFRRVRVEWKGDPSGDNGAYGLYPVQTSNVLIEDSVVIGASDAGIYVGQSNNIIVRRNRAEKNVAGIEIENSDNADVHDNTATGNTGGILVFNLPELQVQNGAVTRIFDNKITDNNLDNFAPAGNIVGEVPRGTGIVLLAAHQIEVFGNEISGNKTSNLSILSYLVTQIAYDDPGYDPYVDTIDIHDNTFGPGGDDYDMTKDLALQVAIALLEYQTEPLMVPDIMFFGFVNPDKADESNPRLFKPEFNLCMRNNGSITYANLDLAFDHTMVTTDMTPHDCSHSALPAVTIAGVE